jgi:hypothetical protein
VFHTARQLLRVIQQRSTTPYKRRQAETALAAALLHDIGHGPFSHAFESVGKKLGLKLARHEYVSEALIRGSEISAVLNQLGSGFADDVAEVIKAKGPRTLYDAVVSSQFDADRLDYMRRDRVMAGSKHGEIDYDWLVANLEIADIPIGVDDVAAGTFPTFVVGSKSIEAAEAYVLGLFQLYTVFRSQAHEDRHQNEARMKVLGIARNANPVALELAATALFLGKEGTAEPWSEVKNLKPTKATSEHLKLAKKLYESLSEIGSPVGLPALQ